MADPVAIVEKIVKLGLKIKDAVDTVRYNEEECQEIKNRVLRFSAILSQLQQTGMMNAAMSGALEDLEDCLQHALELVTACQETSTLRRLFTAGDLSKQLRRVKEDILNKVTLASFAINAHTTLVLLTIQAGGHPHLPPRQPEDAAAGISQSSQPTNGARFELNDVQTNILAGNEGSVAETIRNFRWSELKAATNGFSNGNCIGFGGNCIVYKGVLNDGSIVAIKKSHGNSDFSRSAESNYYKLLHLVSKFQHKNIVKFVGYGHEVLSTSVVQLFKRKKDQAKESGLIWVEEYMPNGSLLDKIIHGSGDYQLDWSSIFRIVEGVAQGVQYLHEQRIIHMDVKPNNILLDSDMNPIITDFENSKALDEDVEVDCIRGTLGYIAPEYIGLGILSVKNDVFAFGTTLLVTVASMRRCPADYYSLMTELNQYKYIGRWAWKAWEAGRIEEEFDLSLFEESQLTQIKRCVEIGLLCTQRDWEDRPTMADVVEMLHGHKELPVPKMPSWFQEDSNSSPL